MPLFLPLAALLLENGSDAVFLPHCSGWRLARCACGGVVQPQQYAGCDVGLPYRAFGKWAARVDDGLNWVPARLTVLTYALVGQFASVIQAWRLRGRQWYSPNAGVVMAAGAGALRLQLGGDASYHGQTKARPALGEGLLPVTADIARAMRLLDRGVYLWVGLLLMQESALWLSHRM